MEELLGWANALKPGMVADCGWRATDEDFGDCPVCLYEREDAASGEETVELGEFLHFGDARLAAAAPDLYRSARAAYGLLAMISNIPWASRVREEIAAALDKAGGGIPDAVAAGVGV